MAEALVRKYHIVKDDNGIRGDHLFIPSQFECAPPEELRGPHHWIRPYLNDFHRLITSYRRLGTRDRTSPEVRRVEDIICLMTEHRGPQPLDVRILRQRHSL